MHAAFQLGRMTLRRQMRLDDGEVPQQARCRHRLSSLPLLTIFFCGIP
jgi:hypothetical protein